MSWALLVAKGVVNCTPKNLLRVYYSICFSIASSSVRVRVSLCRKKFDPCTSFAVLTSKTVKQHCPSTTKHHPQRPFAQGLEVLNKIQPASHHSVTVAQQNSSYNVTQSTFYTWQMKEEFRQYADLALDVRPRGVLTVIVIAV